jgi:hypothetical protein
MLVPVTGLVAATALALLLSLPAQARDAPATPPPPAPAELAAQAGLTEQEHPGLESVFVRPGADLARYDRVLIAPVQVAITRTRDDLMLDERTVEHARDEFMQQFTRALGPGRVATKAGPGVLRMEITVTRFDPNRPAFPRRQTGGWIHESIGIGSAAFQAVLTDSATGQVVAVLADADMGLPLDINNHLHTEFGDADRFVRRWSRQVAELTGGGSGS